MKLNQFFVRHSMADDMTLAVPVAGADFNGLVQGNKTFGVILECLEHDTTEEQIVDALCERFDGDRAVIQADVAGVIARLRGIGAIDE